MSKSLEVILDGIIFGADLGGSSKYSSEYLLLKTQESTLKTEVEKGSIWTAVGYGWVDPKQWVKYFFKKAEYSTSSATFAKGNQVKIPEPEWGLDKKRQRKWTKKHQ